VHTDAVVLEEPGRLTLRQLDLSVPTDEDVVVDVAWSGVSTGTERLLWSGRMPPFPGMGYPLVPGYEAVGRVSRAGPDSGRREGEWVFVPGARCFGPVRGLFGASARTLVVPGRRIRALGDDATEDACLLALAATALHVIRDGDDRLPELIVGHGALGRLLARLAIALGGDPPVVWEIDPERMGGAEGYPVLHPEEDDRRDYATIHDVSGASGLLDRLVGRVERGGEIVLAGFYDEPVSFEFPPAFLKEVRIRVAAEWGAEDLAGVWEHVQSGALSLEGLVTHRLPADRAEEAYGTAFGEPRCVKMILEWRTA